MKHVKQMRIAPNAKASEILAAMRFSGVLGGGRMARAVTLLKKMFSDPDCKVFLTLAGPVVAGGLRIIISDLIRRGCVGVVISNGANITHDIIEALGFRHIRGDFYADDVKLSEKGLGRIGDVYLDLEAFKKFEKTIHQMLDNLKMERGAQIPVSEMLKDFGRTLKDRDSIIVNAARMGVPVFCPGILDSMLGLHLWTYRQSKELPLDMLADMTRLADVVYEAKRVGLVVLGGGMPKHFAMGASMLRGGVDLAVQITMDRPETGSLSGATLEEAISWRKAKTKGNLVTVIADYTIAFPFIVASALSSQGS